MTTTDQYRDLWHRLGALALGPASPPHRAIITEVWALLRDHAGHVAGGNLSRAALAVDGSRTKLRAARGWLTRSSPMRALLDALPITTWSVGTVALEPDGAVRLLLSPEARALLTSGPCRVTVERIDS